jgi:hypothetical protein
MIGIRITERGGSVDENQIHHAIEQAYQLIVEAHRNMTDIWRTHVLFTRQWWFGVGLSICPWLFWIGFRDKRATGQFLLSGFTMIIVTSWLDQLGIAMGLWHYHWEVIPFMPANFPWNFSLLPVTVMFLHQYKSGIHPLFKALLFGGFSAFVAEPVSQMADLYHPVHWKHTYSFPNLCRAVPAGFKHCQEGHRLR